MQHTFTAQDFSDVQNSTIQGADPYDLVKHKVRHHDQKENHQDHVETDILSQHFTQPGHFLNVGANDGRDQTLPLLQSGWHGTYCEPDPTAVARLLETTQEHWDRVTILNVAISPNGGMAPFHLASKNYLSSLQSGWAESLGHIVQAPMHGPVGYKSAGTIWHNCLTMTQLLERSDQVFDYIQTDAEGSDMDIIASVDWSRFPGTQMICTEAQTTVLKHLCRSGNFMITDQTPTNSIYRHRSCLL
jgi:FkbM family methyltransferase